MFPKFSTLCFRRSRNAVPVKDPADVGMSYSKDASSPTAYPIYFSLGTCEVISDYDLTSPPGLNR
jgi:hypothetical protein